MLRTELEPPVVQSCGKAENPAHEITLAKTAFVLDAPEDLGSANGVLDDYPCPGYFPVGCFLLGGKFFPSWLLHGLEHGCVIRTVPLVSRILPKYASVGEGVHFISDFLVVHPPFDSRADKEYEPCQTGDYRILDSMFLLLPAVMGLLKARIGRPRDLAFRAVVDQFVNCRAAAPSIQESPEGRHVGSRHVPGVVNSHAEYLSQGMDPLPALLLAHSKTGGMIFLRRIVLEVGKDEEQPFGDTGKRTVGLYDMGPLPDESLALYVVPPEKFIVCVREKWQYFVKKRYADTCECQKRGRIFSCIRIFHTFDNVKIARMRA